MKATLSAAVAQENYHGKMRQNATKSDKFCDCMNQLIMVLNTFYLSKVSNLDNLYSYCSAVLSFACSIFSIYLARGGLLILWLFVIVVVIVVVVVVVMMVVSRLHLFLYRGEL
jgi:hypothetical protein